MSAMSRARVHRYRGGGGGPPLQARPCCRGAWGARYGVRDEARAQDRAVAGRVLWRAVYNSARRSAPPRPTVHAPTACPSSLVQQALGQHFKCSAASAEQLDAGSAAWAVQVKQLALADIPSIQRLSPRVVLAGQAAPVTFTVGGRSLPRRDLDPAADGHAAPVAVSPRGPGRRELLVRGQGRVHACTVRCAPNAADLPAEGGAEAGRVPEELHLVLPVGATAAGLLLVEARNGTLAGGAAPVLAVPTSDVLAELQQALHDAPTGSCDALLHDLGLILECFASAETTTAAADAAAAAGMPRSALPGPGPAATATPVPAEAVGLEGGSVDAQAMVAQMLAGAGHRQRAEAVACRLLAHAVDQGWRATAGMLLRGLRSNLGMPLSEVQVGLERSRA